VQLPILKIFMKIKGGYNDSLGARSSSQLRAPVDRDGDMFEDLWHYREYFV
jgi:hypothetical protein